MHNFFYPLQLATFDNISPVLQHYFSNTFQRTNTAFLSQQISISQISAKRTAVAIQQFDPFLITSWNPMDRHEKLQPRSLITRTRQSLRSPEQILNWSIHAYNCSSQIRGESVDDSSHVDDEDAGTHARGRSSTPAGLAGWARAGWHARRAPAKAEHAPQIWGPTSPTHPSPLLLRTPTVH